MTYTVEEVVGSREWEGNYGKNIDYTIALVGVPEQVRLTQKPETPAPKPGDELDVTLEDFPPAQVEKFSALATMKKAVKPKTFGGGGGGFGGGGPRPEDPKRSARILRQHSQDMAIQVIRLALEMAILPEAEKPADMPSLLSLVRRTADFLDADVSKVGDAA